MSSPLAPGMIVKATHIVQGQFGQVAMPSMHYNILSIVGAPTDVDVATMFDGIGSSELIPMMANGASYKGSLAQIIQPLPVRPRVQVTAGTGPGSGGSQPMPQQVCGLCTFTTAKAGRSQRGRYYVPFPSVSFITAGIEEPNGAYQALLNNLSIVLAGANSVGSGGNTAAIVAVVYHRDFLTFDPITARTFRVKWATQRRRGDFGRVNISPI